MDVETWPRTAEERLQAAFELSLFIHGDRETARAVTLGAALKVDVAAAGQDKRLYYRPQAALLRTKVSWSDFHLLQRMVFIESEKYERKSEEAAADSLTQEEMILRFVKHLVQITMRRNSFYGTLGIVRILHTYPTSDAIAIYDALLPDADRIKPEDYFRSRKAVLMEELKRRFGSMLSTVRGIRGEERFQARPGVETTAAFLGTCLEAFTPWRTRCWSPDPAHSIADGRADDERREASRFHALLHPECFRKLTRTLRLDDPQRRLEIPRFTLSTRRDRDGPRKGRDRVPLSPQELQAIQESLARESERRRRSSAGLLRVFVDGAERARLDPEEPGSIQFQVDESAELLEVRRSGIEPVLLATHLFTDLEKARPGESSACSITLEGGQRVSVRISRPPEPPATGATLVTVQYRKAGPVRAFFSRLERLIHQLTAPPLAAMARPVWLVLIFAAIVAALLLYRESGRSKRPDTGIASMSPRVATPEALTQPTPAPAAAGTRASAPTSSAQRSSPEPVPPLPRKEERPESRMARRSPSDRIEAPGGEESMETRALSAEVPGVGLSEARRIVVEAAVPEDVGPMLREEIERLLDSSGRIATVAARKDADAILRVSIRPASAAGPAAVEAVLINARGNAIWPLEKSRRLFRLSEKPSATAREIVEALLEDLRRVRASN